MTQLTLRHLNQNKIYAVRILIIHKLKIVNIIKPEIENYMAKKYKIAQTENDIRYRRAAIKRYEKKLSALQGTIDCYKSYIQKDTAALAKLEEEFITSKMAPV